MDAWITIIQTLGFPVVMCGAMGWYVKYITDMHHEELNNIHAEHKEEGDKFVEAITNNTIALRDLVNVLKVDNDAERV